MLGEVQAAWSNEDVAKLHTLATPEMVSYFTKDLEENKNRNDINKVSDVKLLQGDLAEAWREGETDYASVAMRFSLVDKTLERGTNRLVAGSETADRGDGGLDLRAAARQRLGTLGDPADLIVCDRLISRAPRFIPRRLFFCGAGSLQYRGTGITMAASC